MGNERDVFLLDEHSIKTIWITKFKVDSIEILKTGNCTSKFEKNKIKLILESISIKNTI